MSRILAQLLDESENSLSAALQKLEDLCGYPSLDVKFIAGNKHQTLHKNRQLGLDPHDTTAHELHHALLTRFARDEKKLSALLGISNTDNSIARLWKIVDAATEANIVWDTWSLKRSSAKKFLRVVEPRNLMKELNYRSIESMLKRENITELFAAISYTESPTYIKRLTTLALKLQPSDFETKPLEILIMPGERWSKAIQRPATVQCLPLMGAIALHSWSRLGQPSNLALYCLVLQAIDAVRVRNASLKLQQVTANFGHSVSKMINGEVTSLTSLTGLPIAWRSLHHFWGRQKVHNFPDSLGPHLRYEDIITAAPTRILSGLDKTFSWWHDGAHTVSEFSGKKVSFNLVDVAVNYLAGPNSRVRSLRYGREALWDELIKTYLKNPSIEQFMLSHLDANMLQPQPITISDLSTESLAPNRQNFSLGTI